MIQIERFEQPSSLDEALRLLGPGVAPVAGGTDFCVNPRFRAGVHTVVDIRRCGLSWIRDEGEYVSIGAATTMREVAESPLIGALARGIIAAAAATCGSPNVRNVASIGGNSASALPSADTPPTLLALDAEAVLAGPSGQRSLPLEAFFEGPGRNALRQELLVALRVPSRPRQAAFQKLGRAADDIAVVNATAAFEVADGRLRNVRVVAGAVAPVPLRCRQAEAALEGQAPDAELFRQAAALASQEVAPISDQRASADYRRRTAGVLVRRALEDAWSKV